MEKKELVRKTIQGEVILTKENEWYFLTDEGTIYSCGVCSAIDEILNMESNLGDKFKISIERIEEDRSEL